MKKKNILNIKPGDLVRYKSGNIDNMTQNKIYLCLKIMIDRYNTQCSSVYIIDDIGKISYWSNFEKV